MIFGATGHLTATKLLPALFHLENAGRLAKNMTIIAFARREWSLAQWQQHVSEALKDLVNEKTRTPQQKKLFAQFAPIQQSDSHTPFLFPILSLNLY